MLNTFPVGNIFKQREKQPISCTILFTSYSAIHSLFFTQYRVASFATLSIFLNVPVCVCVCVQRQGLHDLLFLAFSLTSLFSVYSLSNFSNNFIMGIFEILIFIFSLHKYILSLYFQNIFYSILYNICQIVNL